MIKKRPIQKFLTVTALISLFVLFFSVPQAVEAQAGSAAEVLAEINGVRAANGLAPLSENIYLNIAAQTQADYIAETGVGSHIGEGGTTSADRALAAGYGQGATVWVTENWAKGPGLTAYECVYNMWVPSQEHLDNILTTWHNEFGAGVALDAQGFTVYVAVFGHTSGSSIPVQATITPGGPTLTQVPYIQPVITSTPNPDGSVIHIVQSGQSLWAISDAYEIPLADLLSLNNLTEEDAIFPDEQLLIVPASEAVTTPTGTPDTDQFTPTPEPTQTRTPTPEKTSEESQPTSTPTPKERNNFLVNIFSGDTLWLGIGLVAVSVLGIALLLFTSSRLK